jgi:23S rRNA pseudouridine1911/1915/1917 synthase
VNESPDYSSQHLDASRHELTIPQECAGLRLDQALAQLFPAHSRSRLQGWLKAGLVTLDGGARDAKFKVWGGERVHLVEPRAPEQAACDAQDIPLDVVYEDDVLLVVNKPVGLVVHPGSGNWTGTMLNALLHRLPQLAGVPRAGIVHRLDKDTSGLMVVAKSLEAQTSLIRQLQGETAATGLIDKPIGRHPTQRTRMAVVDSGRPAVTRFRVKERFVRATLVECQLETGRTHQIRVHMASIGHPLIGDATYGARRCGSPLLDAFARQALHAYRLGLRHPQRDEPLEWEVALPADFAQLLAQLRATEASR